MPSNERSNIISVLDEVMLNKPEYWVKYYHGDEREKAFKRKYSLSDRIRYYWTHPMVQQAFEKMMESLNKKFLPGMLLNQFVPDVYTLDAKALAVTPEQILLTKIRNVLWCYARACHQ